MLVPHCNTDLRYSPGRMPDFGNYFYLARRREMSRAMRTTLARRKRVSGFSCKAIKAAAANARGLHQRVEKPNPLGSLFSAALQFSLPEGSALVLPRHFSPAAPAFQQRTDDGTFSSVVGTRGEQRLNAASRLSETRIIFVERGYPYCTGTARRFGAWAANCRRQRGV